MSLLAFVAHATAAPQIQCDSPQYEFGELSSDVPIEHTFVITNNGDEPLTISDVKSSCGCTTTDLKSAVVSPGESVDLQVKAKLVARTGIQSKTVKVHSDDPKTPELVLSIKGQVTAPVMLEPYRLYFGNVKPNDQLVKAVKVLLEEPETTITRVEVLDEKNFPLASDNPNWRVTIERSEDQIGYVLSVHAQAPSMIGRHAVMVAVYTDHPKVPMVRLPVSITVSGALSIAPDEILVFQEPTGESKPQGRYLSIRRTDHDNTSPFHILKITPPNDGVQVEVKSIGSDAYRIKVDNLRVEDVAEDSQLVIETDVPEMKTIEIPVRIYKRKS